MSSNTFKQFAAAIGTQLSNMLSLNSPSTLFTVKLDRNELFDTYLAAFPEGTNPIFRVRTEHDGSYDRNFIRNVGGVIKVNDDLTIETIWDVADLPYPYDIVAKALADKVRESVIDGILYSTLAVSGHEPNTEVTDQGSIDFTHFYNRLPSAYVTSNAASLISDRRNAVTGFKNALEQLSIEATRSVMELIDEDCLYRGDQYERLVRTFLNLLTAYKSINDPITRDRFLYRHNPITIRSTAIGTLIEDLTGGMDLDTALRRYGNKVDPVNYNHSKAAITPGMIKRAMATITELGLEPALERRHAVIEDVAVTDVLWANRNAKSKLKGGIEGILMASARVASSQPDQTIQIGIKDFIKLLADNAECEIFLTPDLGGNMVSLIAPVHGDLPPSLFAWDNNFSWAYNGNVTDSITRRVKAAGGKTDGVMRVSLAWSNTDDLDLHCQGPDGHIYFGNKAGILDIDANGPGSARTTTPVENMNFSRIVPGVYKFFVHQYAQRNTTDQGYEIEVALGGQVTQYRSETSPPQEKSVTVLEIAVEKDLTISRMAIGPHLKVGTKDTVIWGLDTGRYVPVETVMYSPNYWGQTGLADDELTNDAGNRHYIFTLAGCKSDEPLQGIFNEYLRSNLKPHRKVFEVIGQKTKCPTADVQLSGLGFSSTIRRSFTARLTGDKGPRVYTVQV